MSEERYYVEEPVKTRAQKVLEAKRAFSERGMPYEYGNDRYSDYDVSDISDENHESSGVFFRFVCAALFFGILAIAFYNDFSYHGIDKEYVMHCISDNSDWDKLLKGVGSIVDEVTNKFR